MTGTIAILQGGLSAECEVSNVTGQAFAQALTQLGLDYTVIQVDSELPRQLMDLKPSVALLALHGKYAEDGTVQGLCEYLKIPYSGSGVLASAFSFDKAATYRALRCEGLPTPAFQVIDTRRSDLTSIHINISIPCVVKPAREGSSVGISIVNEEDELRSALRLAAQSDQFIMVEDYIAGMELTVAVVDGKPHTPIEIVPKSDYYNYENKYTPGKTDYFLPPRLDETVIEKCKSLAVAAYECCRMRNFARVDFRVKDGIEPMIIEINALPGCTPTSLFPKAMAYDGIEFKDVIKMFVDTAGLDYEGVD